MTVTVNLQLNRGVGPFKILLFLSTQLSTTLTKTRVQGFNAGPLVVGSCGRIVVSEMNILMFFFCFFPREKKT